jgi:hypothetical protein
VGVGSAGAAAAAKPQFSRGIGPVLPNDGTQAQVSIECPGGSGGVCRGSVALVPRGATARSLGSGAVASRSFTLARGADADLRLRLSGPARTALSRGPLFLTAILRAAGSGSPPATLKVAIARERRDTAPLRLVSAAHVAAAGIDEFHWLATIPALSVLYLGKFTCPANFPVVAGVLGVQRGPPGVPPHYRADIQVTASGADYAGFDRPELGGTERQVLSGYIFTFRLMAGWAEGNLLYNSIWTGFSAVDFKLKVSCTVENGTRIRARYLDSGNDPESRGYKLFFPWK